MGIKRQVKTRDAFWEYVKKEYPEQFWYFLRKVNERLEILFKHKVPNHFELDETDEALIFDLYKLFKESSLFQPTDELTSEEYKQFTDKVSPK